MKSIIKMVMITLLIVPALQAVHTGGHGGMGGHGIGYHSGGHSGMGHSSGHGGMRDHGGMDQGGHNVNYHGGGHNNFNNYGGRGGYGYRGYGLGGVGLALPLVGGVYVGTSNESSDDEYSDNDEFINKTVSQ